MIETFLEGIERGFGAFGWCLAFLGGWIAVAALLITVGAAAGLFNGEEGEDDD